MKSCIRCRESLSEPAANYCGNCGFPIVDDTDEEEIREMAKREQQGFLNTGDINTIFEVQNEGAAPPADAYQWYLEEGVRKALLDFAILQRWDWFDPEPILTMFFQDVLLEEEPSDDAIEEFMLWARVWAFFTKRSDQKDSN